MQSFWNSVSALNSGLSWLNTAANNISNENTPGFAQQHVSFADTLTRQMSAASTAPALAARYTPPGWWGGSGVVSGNVDSQFSQMPLSTTGNPTDLAIQGNAFFLIGGPHQTTYLTKAGNFQWSPMGNGTMMLSTPQGQPVLDVNGKPVVVQGTSSSKFGVSPGGKVTIDGKAGPTLAMVDVSLPGQNLSPVGNNLYQASSSAAPVVINKTGTPTGNSLVQGALSQSNVDLTSAMTDMLSAQRMFDLNSQALQLDNLMSQTAVSIRP